MTTARDLVAANSAYALGTTAGLGDSLEYRQMTSQRGDAGRAHAAVWTAFTGSIVEISSATGFAGAEQADTRMATLRTDTSQQLFDVGDLIRDGYGTVWAVMSRPERHDGQRRYEIEERSVDHAAPRDRRAR